ncbi:MAG: DNA-3-methyladenine glycosylase 2 family protein [Flavobacteriales bacterium]|nr:DNA-3-methyladenine glycosylase 2 family protein [Flavobacteriales bacterium]
MKGQKAIQKHLSGQDPVMARLITEIGPCALKKRDPYRALLGSIVSQQLSTKAADTIWKRMMEVIGHDLSADNILKYSVEDFRSAGLSNAKASWVLDLSDRVIRGAVDLNAFDTLDDDAVKKELLNLKGIGSWTADMFLMFSLNRLDILPVGDVGIQRAIRVHYGLKSRPSERTMVRIARNWQPYRTVACWYLWQSLDA